ncbi:hypothetical protein Tco_0392653 [Tanacetum coccineum]
MTLVCYNHLDLSVLLNPDRESVQMSASSLNCSVLMNNCDDTLLRMAGGRQELNFSGFRYLAASVFIRNFKTSMVVVEQEKSARDALGYTAAQVSRYRIFATTGVWVIGRKPSNKEILCDYP